MVDSAWGGCQGQEVSGLKYYALNGSTGCFNEFHIITQ